MDVDDFKKLLSGLTIMGVADFLQTIERELEERDLLNAAHACHIAHEELEQACLGVKRLVCG